MNVLATVVLLGLASRCYTTFSEGFRNPKLDNILEENDRKYETYLTSIYASAEERAKLISKGLAGTTEYLNRVLSSKPSPSTLSLDCKIKGLAFDFAKQLSAGTTTTAELKYIFDGLELGALCNKTFHAVTHTEAQYKQQKDDNFLRYFVDHATGRNYYDGSFYKPFKSIQTGINACRVARKSWKYTSCNILIRGGLYKLSESLTIGDNDITISNYQEENVILTSDKVVTPEWKHFKSSLQIYKTLNPLFEGIEPKQSTESVVYVGIMDSYMPCEKTCLAQLNCSAFVYFDKTTASYTDQCYLRLDGMWNTIKHSGAISGKKVGSF